MRIEPSVESDSETAVTADISPRSEDFSGSVIVRPAAETAVDTDRSCSRRSFRTFEVIIVECSCIGYMLLA